MLTMLTKAEVNTNEMEKIPVRVLFVRDWTIFRDTRCKAVGKSYKRCESWSLSWRLSHPHLLNIKLLLSLTFIQEYTAHTNRILARMMKMLVYTPSINKELHKKIRVTWGSTQSHMKTMTFCESCTFKCLTAYLYAVDTEPFSNTTA